MRTIDRPTDGTAASLFVDAKPGRAAFRASVPVVLQKSTEYPPAIRIQPSPSSMPTSHCGRKASYERGHERDDGDQQQVNADRGGSHRPRARVLASRCRRKPGALGAHGGESARSTRSSSRTAERTNDSPGRPRDNPVVCRKIASRTSGLAATSRRACLARVACEHSVCELERLRAGQGGAQKPVQLAALEASSATTRSMTR